MQTVNIEELFDRVMHQPIHRYIKAFEERKALRIQRAESSNAKQVLVDIEERNFTFYKSILETLLIDRNENRAMRLLANLNGNAQEHFFNTLKQHNRRRRIKY
ncbi:hypothetical protein PP175_26415 (plasmid) [Aneurinibacillus sp. Ricciae_BoGa-3]|uniref:hypothetical protein n=1 Tax=Aneurinibacillus sp. Ricciae_BoGa-3 TaxID=3022697 RepID=UPI002341F982|nr:hypothetical protein [Aneurinibacillus sp. Ricciae_BoGa-3]WCK57602.1 hypothetical protein PP175_26415 [Aneurinibacillus sp. Ricciae_BoGa-3]